MDVGQGDSTLIVYPDRSLTLIDCGSKKNSKIVLTEVQKVLTAYLGATGNTLKSMVLTHPDGDHFNLVKTLIVDAGVQVGELFYGGVVDHYGNISDWITNKGNGKITKVTSLSKSYFNPNPHASLSYTSQTNANLNVEGRILAANVGDPKVKTDANPNSVVVLLTFNNFNMFLMGDATTQTENFILAWDKLNGTMTKLLQGRLAALKAGHHGSNTSSGLEWIQKVKPQVVFISSDTKTFSGVTIPRSGVIDRIFANSQVVDLFPNQPNDGQHLYVQYNDTTQVHENKSSVKAMCTTLNLLKFTSATEFTAYGTSWYYTIAATSPQEWAVYITPACGWANVNTAY